MRKVIKWILAVLAFLMVVLLVTPYVFKDKIVSLLKQNLNESLHAHTDFTDISLSFFRSFPNLAVSVYGLQVDGVDEFQGIPLLKAEEVSGALNLWSVVKGSVPIQIVTLSAKNPDLNILILPDGKANYDIAIGDTSTIEADTESELQFNIEQYQFSDASLRYEDQTMPMIMSFDRLDHSGKGDFASMQFDLETVTHAEGLTLNYDGVNYLVQARADLTATIAIDLKNYRYTLKDNQLTLNELELNGSGFIDINEEDIELDLTLAAPKSDFRQLVSILPGAYVDAFKEAQIAGTFDLQHHIWGTYSAETFPAFTLKTLIQDGALKYPDLPMGISNINVDLSIEKSQGNLDLLKVDATKIELQVGPQPLSGFLTIRTPLSDPDVAGRIKGTLDLANLSKAYPLSGVDQLAGQLRSDIEFKAKQSQIEKQDFAQMQVQGILALQDLVFQATESPDLKIDKSQLTFTPQAVELSETSVRAGRSDFTIKGEIENILAFINPQQTVKGNFSFRSSLLDLDEWYQATAQADESSVEPVTTKSIPAIPGFDFGIDALVEELLFKGQKITNARVSGDVSSAQVSITEMTAAMAGSDLRLQGALYNIPAYLSGEGKLSGNVILNSKRLNLNPFMSETSAIGNEETGSMSPFIIPENVTLEITTSIGELTYTDMTFTNLTGQIIIDEQTANLKNCSSEAFGGRFQLEGGYRTQIGDKPNFDLKYQMTDVQFSQIASHFEFVKILAPIIKFLDGRFSTSFITNGELQDNFMPDLATLNLEGLVETSECFLKSFGPAEKLAELLKINFLKSPKIKNTKNWLEIKNGIMEIKEFDYVVEDVAMQISGTQALTQDINYLIKMKIPRKYLDANEITKGFNAGFSWLTSEASKLGFKLSDGEHVNVNVIMTGTITKPEFDLKLVGMDGEKPLVEEVKDEFKAGVAHAVDSAKTVAEAKRDSLLKKGEEKADKIIDTLTNEAIKQVDTLTNRASQELKKKVDAELSKQAGEVIDDKVGEIGGEKAKEQVDKVVDKLKGWKPFGKKQEEVSDTTASDTTSRKKGNL